MYTINNKIVDKILQRKFNSLVGEMCERLERLNTLNISNKELTDQIKFEFKKNSWNTMREIQDQLSSFSEGTIVSVDLI